MTEGHQGKSGDLVIGHRAIGNAKPVTPEIAENAEQTRPRNRGLHFLSAISAYSAVKCLFRSPDGPMTRSPDPSQPCPSESQCPKRDWQPSPKILPETYMHHRVGRFHHNDVGHTTGDCQIARQG